LSADRDSVAEFFIDDNIVSATNGEVSEETCHIGSDAEVLGVSWVDVQQFVHVKELDAMIASFRSDDHVIFVRANFSPDRKDGLLRKATKVD